jgi:acetyl-CoA carboxylase carboxyltransferase component
MFELAREQKLPVVFLTEGGGGRPGDTDAAGVSGLDCLAFQLFAGLSALVPLVGITSGRCFAGNAVLLGCCDVIIATAGSNIGIGGPAMIEGGGLGLVRPDEIGPMDVQTQNGVVDVAVADEAEAVQVAKQYLSYFQGPLADWECSDQRALRSIIPENRLRAYDVRQVVRGLADTGSQLELRREWGHGIITSLIRVEGRPLGVIANNPNLLAGAIDRDGADKATRFMQLCDAFDLPILFLCDCPGIMVGPEIEKTALVRHASRMFGNAASLTVPFATIVLRKGYGLGAQAMAGSFSALVTVSCDGRIRRHGPRGRGEARLQQGARGRRRRRGARAVRRDGRAHVPDREGGERRLTLRARRRDRPRRFAHLDRERAPLGASPPRAGKKRPASYL